MPSDVQWGAGIVMGVQTALGTINTTIQGFGTTGGDLTTASGIVLGVTAEGTGESGITMPSFVAEYLERPDIGGTLSRARDALLRTDATGLALNFEWKGNGVPATIPTPPSAEPKPLAGVDAIIQSAGFVEGTLADNIYPYIPLGSPIYMTVVLFVADQSWTFQDCLVSSLELPHTGQEVVQGVATIEVGSIDAHNNTMKIVNTAAGANEVNFNYGTMATLAPLIAKNAAFTWNTVRGAGTLVVTVNNDTERIPDINTDNGRLVVNGRQMDVTGEIWVDDDSAATREFEYKQVDINADPITLVDMTWRLGIAAVSNGDLYNGTNYDMALIQVDSIEYDRAGFQTRANIVGHATSTAGNDELTITFD